MFNVLLNAMQQSRSRYGVARPVRWLAPLSAAALNFSSIGGCALDERPGDGVVSDGLEVVIAPTLVYDAGGPPEDAGGSPCVALALFEQKVVPHFLKSCALDCHDGTKSKAGADLYMGLLKSDTYLSCAIALGGGITPTLTRKLDAPMLTSSDPLNLAHMHDFKYETSAEFNAYRDDVMVWISAERPDLP